MKSINVTALNQLINNKEDFQLIDVREAYEHTAFNIGGTLIPLGDITKQLHQIEKEKPVILYCRAGVRSQIAIQRLQEKFDLKILLILRVVQRPGKRNLVFNKGYFKRPGFYATGKSVSVFPQLNMIFIKGTKC